MQGYYWRKDFYTGNISGLPLHVSWRGNDSLHWTEMKKAVYPAATTYVHDDLDHDQFSVTPITLLPFMDCVEISNFTRNIFIGTKGAVQLFIADPDTQPSYRIHTGSMTGELISVGTFIRPSFKEIVYPKIKISLSSKRSDKNDCQSHNKFAECADSQVKTRLISLLGCIPPWISNFKNVTYCNQDLVYNTNSHMSVARDTLKIFYNQVRNMKVDIDLESECNLPCKKMLFNVQKIGYEIADIEENWINIMFDEEVTILEEKSNYTELDLIVDAGSSLGLWIGLSALGVFDVLYEFAFKVGKLMQKLKVY